MVSFSLIKSVNKRAYFIAAILMGVGVVLLITSINLPPNFSPLKDVLFIASLPLLLSRFFLGFFKDNKSVVGKIEISENEITIVEKNQICDTFPIDDIWGFQFRLVEFEGEQRWSDRWLRYPGKRWFRTGDINWIEFYHEDKHYKYSFKIYNELQFQKIKTRLENFGNSN